MGIELYAIKPFMLGAFLTWYAMRKAYKKPKIFYIREI
jgi:hypothetical protein